jgi:ATP-dependent Clp protease ATP-binding subunit ClpC
MTSNIGARDLQDFGAGIGFGTKARQENIDEITKGTITSALRKTFSPEFLNRLDDVIVFNSLEKKDIHKIIDISLSKLLNRVLALGYRVELTDKAKDFVAEKGYDPKFGARPLNRAIQKYIEDPIAEEILKAQVLHGDIITADYEEGKEELTFSVSKSDEKPNLASDERPAEAPSEPENGETK